MPCWFELFMKNIHGDKGTIIRLGLTFKQITTITLKHTDLLSLILKKNVKMAVQYMIYYILSVFLALT